MPAFYGGLGNPIGKMTGIIRIVNYLAGIIAAYFVWISTYQFTWGF